jgi:hypothetical protein
MKWHVQEYVAKHRSSDGDFEFHVLDELHDDGQRVITAFGFEKRGDRFEALDFDVGPFDVPEDAQYACKLKLAELTQTSRAASAGPVGVDANGSEVAE